MNATISDVPRTLRHTDTDEQWRERSLEEKVHCTAVDAAYRLRGIAGVHYSIAFADTTHEHKRPEYIFLAGCLRDIALALERVTKAQMAEWNAADPLEKTSKRSRKRAGRRAAT
jgi:hypothetical protein